MNIIVIGAGDVGSYLCAVLSDRGYHVQVIENDPQKAVKIDEELNVRVTTGNGSSAETLAKAHVADCDFFLAMTSDDKTNLIACSLAKALGAKQTIARYHDQTYTDTSFVNYQLHFGIDIMLNPEGLCAVELAKLIRNPDRVAVENFARGQIEVQQVRVHRRSKLIGRPLRELQRPENVQVGYVRRNKEVVVAGPDTRFEADDLVTIFGTPDAVYQYKGKLNPESQGDTVRVVLYGGTETAIALVRLLNNPRFRVRVIERDAALCRSLAEKFTDITVIHGDATSLRVLEEEQVGAADYFVACTKRDEDNIVTGLQASKLGVAHVQIVVNKVDYEEIVTNLRGALGVECSVSPREATVNEILRFVSRESYMELASMPGEQNKIIEVLVGSNSDAKGKSLREIAWPPATRVIALLHKFEAKVPGPDDKILAGDRVVVITHEEQKKKVVRILAG